MQRCHGTLVYICLFSVICASFARAQAAPAQQRPQNLDLLQGRPDAVAEKGDLLLGGMYQNPLAGIAFRTPVNSTQVKAQGEEIARFVNQQRKWELVVTKASVGQPMALSGKGDEKTKGLLEVIAGRLTSTNPGIEIVRQDTVKLPDFEAGMIAARFTAQGERKLLQQVIIQANDQLYYLLTMTAPASKEARGADGADPGELAAVEAFSRMLDSVKLLDRGAVKDDQNERLFRTRALFVNLTPARIRSALIPEQWMRLVQNGKDIGYTYIVEEPDNTAGPDGIRIGIRSRSYPDADIQVDGEAWYFVSGDRDHENWSNLLWVQNKAKKTNDQITEFGSSDRSVKKVLVGKPPFPKGQNPPVQEIEIYTLNVQTLGNAPVKRELSPWYLPQAMSHLLPRLLPLREPKSFMFAVYVSDEGEVMSRYVEVGSEQIVELEGQAVRAVPITDRIRLEGVPTIHYMTPEGKYLGSVNKQSGTMILPTDAATLQKKWSNPDLSRPKDIKRPPAAASSVPEPAAETSTDTGNESTRR